MQESPMGSGTGTILPPQAPEREMTKKYIFILYLVFASLRISAQEKLKPLDVILLKIKEPSDICISPDGANFFLVSDNGQLVETDLGGKIKRSIKANLVDAEGVCAVEDKIYVADEFTRSIHVFSIKEWKFLYEVPVHYSGARNRGFEAITFHAENNEFYLFSESRPLIMFTLNENLNLKKQIELDLDGDVSAACFHRGKLWLLSDEESSVYLYDLESHTATKKFRLPVLNPEGITFLPDGKLLIVSDDRQRMYVFNLPENL
jgi:uncharacterized protein YjiK